MRENRTEHARHHVTSFITESLTDVDITHMQQCLFSLLVKKIKKNQV